MSLQAIQCATGPLRIGRAESIKSNFKLVKIIAYQMATNLPISIDVQDLISAGTIGLLSAVDRFDATRGVQFSTYASIRIRGAIMDELRSMDWMTRSMRDKRNRVEKAYSAIEQTTGGQAGTEDVARFLGMTVDGVHGLLGEVRAFSVLSLEDLGISSQSEAVGIFECIKDPNAIDPMVSARLNQIKRLVREAIDGLSEKEKLVVMLYYYDELTLKDIGKLIGVTESRVCQLHSQTMNRLRVRLRCCRGSS
ncbi:FliA/WhiG family RNA polymerase sigma factor [bacterium]|nr:MAG: FliA/WhiG family RNA polymerase sigma factor [bacterium]